MSSRSPQPKTDHALVHDRNAPSIGKDPNSWRLEWSSIPGVVVVKQVDTDTGKTNEDRFRYSNTHNQWLELDKKTVDQTFSYFKSQPPTVGEKAKQTAVAHIDGLTQQLAESKHLNIEKIEKPADKDAHLARLKNMYSEPEPEIKITPKP